MNMKLADDIDELRRVAAMETTFEADPNCYLSECGSYDDAYDAGYEDAKIHMARSVLRILGRIAKEPDYENVRKLLLTATP